MSCSACWRAWAGARCALGEDDCRASTLLLFWSRINVHGTTSCCWTLAGESGHCATQTPRTTSSATDETRRRVMTHHRDKASEASGKRVPGSVQKTSVGSKALELMSG